MGLPEAGEQREDGHPGVRLLQGLLMLSPTRKWYASVCTGRMGRWSLPSQSSDPSSEALIALLNRSSPIPTPAIVAWMLH